MLKNMDIVEYYGYDYKNLKIPSDLIYSLYVKIWGSLDLKD